MRLLVTGANGFVGKNLLIHLSEMDSIEVLTFTRSNDPLDLPDLIHKVDAIIHLAGINRPEYENEFFEGNLDLTRKLSDAVRAEGRPIPILYSSSIQAERDNPYGRSKLAAESELLELSQETSSPVYIYRLANVFGKWCKPNYNSMVATFCHNICRGLPIEIHNHDALVELVYIDDVVSEFVAKIKAAVAAIQHSDDLPASGYVLAKPVYSVTVGEIAEQLRGFKASRDTLITDRVGNGFTRKLYSTYVSYLPTNLFKYKIPKHGDKRGIFVEMLKTSDSGQFSFFTAHPGVTRGGHYHHSKTEKFLVLKGQACFRFRSMETDEFYEVLTSDELPEVVETVPGWSHDITNVGKDEMIVMLWANEIFDPNNPDTYACAVGTE